MPIQNTDITHIDDGYIVDITISDNPDLEQAAEVVQASVPVTVEQEYPLLVELQLAALERMRTLVGDEIQVRRAAANQSRW